jgi:hypothetical protein
MLIVSTSGQVTGLANAGSELYVSDSAANRIRVYDAETMAELRSWSVDRPKQIAVDTQIDTPRPEGARILGSLSQFAR